MAPREPSGARGRALGARNECVCEARACCRHERTRLRHHCLGAQQNVHVVAQDINKVWARARVWTGRRGPRCGLHRIPGGAIAGLCGRGLGVEDTTTTVSVMGPSGARFVGHAERAASRGVCDAGRHARGRRVRHAGVGNDMRACVGASHSRDERELQHGARWKKIRETSDFEDPLLRPFSDLMSQLAGAQEASRLSEVVWIIQV